MNRLIDRLLYGRSSRLSYLPGGGYGGYGMGRAPVLELLVPMCCSKCEEKVYEEMMELRGVQGVMVDREAARVIVYGFVDPHRALRRAKRVKRDSQIWTTGAGAPYGRDIFSSPKYRRSSYVSPSVYRSSALEYQPSMYEPSSVYRTSYNRYTPSYGLDSYAPYERELYASPYAYGRGAYGPSYGMHHEWPMYDGYSDVVTNPYYLQHMDSEYY